MLFAAQAAQPSPIYITAQSSNDASVSITVDRLTGNSYVMTTKVGTSALISCFAQADNAIFTYSWSVKKGINLVYIVSSQTVQIPFTSVDKMVLSCVASNFANNQSSITATVYITVCKLITVFTNLIAFK